MKWKEDYATGVAEIDEQHRSLFAFSEEFRDVLENGFGEKTYDLFLEFLKSYAEAHFTFEEECMLAHLCPVSDQNRKEHVSFRRMVENEISQYEAHGFDRQRALKLTKMIDQWLDSHICRIDAQLRNCTS